MNIKKYLAGLSKTKLLILLALIVVAVILIRFGTSVKGDYYLDKPHGIKQVEAVGDIPIRATLPQGKEWTQKQRELYWFTSQGSQMMPYTWFMWIEQADNESLFRSADFIEKIGYLPSPSSELNPGGLPIGFTAQRPRKNKKIWMGFNCAACHTNQIDFNGQKIMVEGAPTLGNFKILYDEMIKSMIATVKNEDKFNRFAANVLGEDSSNKRKRDKLKEELTTVYRAAEQRQVVNALPRSEFPEDFAGYARVDAFGQIANSASAFALHDLTNNNPPSAPVSYPFLWGTHQSDVVQWNASAPNIPIVGPLVRNVGEVAGVFGSLSIHESPWYWKYLMRVPIAWSSTVDYEGIGDIELWIKQLRSPQWPENILPELDERLIAEGAILFQSECSDCHQVMSRSEEGDIYKAHRTPLKQIGTDPIMAYNANNITAKTLILEGTKQSVAFGDDFGATAGVSSILVNGLLGVMIKRAKRAIEAGKKPYGKDATKDLKEYLKDLKLEKEKGTKSYVNPHDSLVAPNALGPTGPNLNLDSLVYKGRPLNGIWATAPYLHNGSVPNLWELLKDPSDRVTSFKVGSREFDAVNVGFRTDVGPGDFNVLRPDSTIMPGNSNMGHTYGTEFTDEQKWALVEYMKSL